MLIINFTEKPVQKKNNIFKKRKEENVFDRYNLRLKNKVFTVVNTSLDVNDIELLRLIKYYKGKLLKTNNTEFNSIYSDMLFDCYQYNKRAILSSFCKSIKKYSSVCIVDNDFRLNQEIVDIAKISKKICIIGSENIDVQRFSDYCYLKLGLKVVLNDLGFKSDAYINLKEENIGNNTRFLVKNNEDYLTPDTDYYTKNEFVEKLIELNVPFYDACAALEIKANSDVCWTVN